MDSRNLEIIINALGEVIHEREISISCLEYKVKKLEAENESLKNKLDMLHVTGGANNDPRES